MAAPAVDGVLTTPTEYDGGNSGVLSSESAFGFIGDVPQSGCGKHQDLSAPKKDSVFTPFLNLWSIRRCLLKLPI